MTRMRSRINVRSFNLVFPLSALCFILGTSCSTQPTAIETSLAKAGDNRAELERVLTHYQHEGDQQKLQAAEFLIANMDGHGYALTAFYDKNGKEVEFDALDYSDFNEARVALDILEKKHGELDYDTKRFDTDLETVSADYLIENIDLAFQAWREMPWAQDLTFDALREYCLGYRGDNEPVNPFRPTCLARYAGLPKKMKDPTDMREAARLVRQDVNQWVKFNQHYYLHPTDQSFEEMVRSGRGRCGDISNMMLYAMRSVAIPAAIDFTPWWAKRDNNHAWEVVLDKNGRGSAGLSHHPAKIFRKTFAVQRDSLACRAGDGAKLPRFLSRRNILDVTDQYGEITDITIRLENAPPAGTRFAYLCVFNDAEWRPIHGGEIRRNHVTFTKMGRDIVYLPAYYINEETRPAGRPFILTATGDIQPLVSQGEMKLTISERKTTESDAMVIKPIEPGKTYEIFAWDGEWKSHGKRVAGAPPLSFDAVPAGALYWLVEEGSRRLERIFTVEGGQHTWW